MPIRDRVKELRRVRASDLRPSPANWRAHPPAQREALRGVLAEVGYADALLARELDGGGLELIDGHLRAETTPDSLVPVLVLDVDAAEAKKLLATLDPLAAMAEADAGRLDALLREVNTGSEALQEMLADLAEKSGVIPADAGKGEVAEDEPPSDVPARCKAGDLWALGEHRLLCGDSTDPRAVKRLMGGEKAALTVTSPPYPGAAMWNESGEEGLTANIGRLRELNRAAFAAACGLTDVVAWNVADVPIGGQTVRYNSADVLAWAGELKATARPIIWDKGIPNPLPPLAFRRKPCVPHLTHEWVFVVYPSGWKPREAESSLGEDSQWQMRSVWTIAPAHATAVGHKAPFPVELAARCIRLFSLDGDSVIDLFAGSGTTVIAAEQLGRRCFGLEIAPAYCDIILARWEKLTGGAAERVG